MTQNSKTIAKLEDVTNVTGRSFFPISKPIINIGSSPENDLVIEKDTVSERHATIEQQPDGHFVVVLSSTGKTLLNGVELEPISTHRLNDGDEISIDTFAFIFKLEETELPQPAPDRDDTIDLDSSMLVDEVKTTDPSQPEPEFEHEAETDPDHDETVFFDSSSLIDELFTADASQPEPESEPEPDPEAETDPDHDETVFFDSSSLIDELFAADPSPPKPEPEQGPEAEAESESESDPEAETDPDHDETVFFDSSSLMDELFTADASQPGPESEPEAETDPDHDETVFLDSGSLLDELEEGESAHPGEDTGGRPPLADKVEPVVGKEPAAPTEITKIGNYEVIKLLGKGGFGSVWQAQTPDGQPVAIKVLNPEVMEDERAVRKFYHEAINLSKMNHPNICRFIDFFPHEGNPAIIMDFVQGTNLQDLLKSQKGPLPFETACLIASQALDGLHYAHQKKVFHRDIKPENITLTTEGVAKIMDFGIASLSSTESQQTSLFMISPAYTAPERFDAAKTDLVDHRADIYALGLVFYEIFTGKHPFPTDKPMEMIMAHLNEVPAPPDEIVDLPQEISDAIFKALEKDPDDRFEDFAAFKMEMLGEAPLRSSDTIGPLELSGEYCKNAAALLKTLSGIVKKHQKQARKITVGQVGMQVNLIIETAGGNVLSITRDIE